MMKNKSYSESETNMLTASTDTLATKRGVQEEVRQDALKVGKFFWNPDKNEVMRQSEIEWARLLLFYFVFFSALVVYASVAFGIYLEVQSSNQSLI